MNDHRRISGVKASVYLSYLGELEALVKKLSVDLSIPDLYVDTDMDPPHDTFGMGEALGFEVWVHKSNAFSTFNFILELRNQRTVEDEFNDAATDISLWLSKHISLVSYLDTGAVIENNKLIVFKNGAANLQ